MKTKSRKLKVNETEILWCCRQKFVSWQNSENGYQSITKLTFYPVKSKKNKLVIEFVTWEDAIGGNPLYTGMPIRRDVFDSVRINLNQPKFVREILTQILKQKLWSPDSAKPVTYIKNGMKILEKIGYDVFEDRDIVSSEKSIF